MSPTVNKEIVMRFTVIAFCRDWIVMTDKIAIRFVVVSRAYHNYRNATEGLPCIGRKRCLLFRAQVVFFKTVLL